MNIFSRLQGWFCRKTFFEKTFVEIEPRGFDLTEVRAEVIFAERERLRMNQVEIEEELFAEMLPEIRKLVVFKDNSFWGSKRKSGSLRVAVKRKEVPKADKNGK